MKNFSLVGALAASLFVIGDAAAQEDWRAGALERLPETGEIHLQLLFEDAPDGFMRLGWVRGEDEITLFDRTMYASREIYETMTMTMDARDFAPRVTDMEFYQGAAIMTVDTTVADGRAIGMRAITHPIEPGREAPVDLELAEGAVFRPAIFMLAPYFGLESGDVLELAWYAPLGNGAATITLTAFDGGTVSTPAGDFSDTLRIELRGASPDNDIYVTTGETRQVVRIDVPGQPMTFVRLPEPAPESE
tara:strand:- start:1116 stop:1859 length:744 start_codon:yes stop_codon:yes gene_type:complete